MGNGEVLLTCISQAFSALKECKILVYAFQNWMSLLSLNVMSMKRSIEGCGWLIDNFVTDK